MRALQVIQEGKSIFLTGSAGTGKSYMLAHAIRLLRIKYGSSAVFVTASTGLAACSIGGTTVHSFGGFGLGESSKEELLEKVCSRRDTRARWEVVRGLVIDEISMIDGVLFDKMDFIARRVRRVNKPFGGIQLVVTGDFFQLPPVSRGGESKRFAFEAACWDSCFAEQLELTRVFRQADSGFVDVLNELRRGRCPPAHEQRLRACRAAAVVAGAGAGGELPPDGIALTRLYPHKRNVALENEQRLRELPGVEMVYRALDDARTEFQRNLLDNTNAVRTLVLKVGAQVILLKNLDTGVGLANGARGVVVGFCAPDLPEARRFQHLAPDVCPCAMWPVVRFAAGGAERVVGPESWAIHDGPAKVAERLQVPLALAWALSVHKCQGMTLDRVETDLAKAFDYGMVYVALSRVRSLEGLRLLGFDKSTIKVHPKVAEYYETLAAKEQPEDSDQ